ncbi:MAG: PD-(D/E)XK nuclease domain-containing protein [Candidatus Electronema sp. V4]|uniref:PD-(D/E)XK nuclease domain-containing protein n=1 Tax=Candidatus Electronema sp. V4 TaxID=3454756 RepID=UPI0040555E56
MRLICLRFHAVASQLRSRHKNRNTLEIEDEYDVQDLLHALLRLYFDDVRAEEWTPSYAGGCSRVDFLLKAEQVVIEVKKTRKGLAAKDIGDQLLIDIQRYQAHPDCKTLVCFVYDPEGRIANPRGIEADLNKQHGSVLVEVIIAPRSS